MSNLRYETGDVARVKEITRLKQQLKQEQEAR